MSWQFVLVVHGVVLSVWLVPEKRQPPLWVYGVALWSTVVMTVLAAPQFGKAGMGAAVELLGMIVGLACHAPLFYRASGEFFQKGVDIATGIDQQKIEAIHARALAATKRGDHPAALAILTEAAGNDEEDAECRRLAAELEVARGRRAEAQAWYEEAYRRSTESGRKGSVGLRASEEAPDATRARSWLVRVRGDLAGTPFEGYAIERLRRLDGARKVAPLRSIPVVGEHQPWDR